MQQVKSVITEFKGNHYDFGRHQAEWLKTTLMMENRAREWRLRRPRFDINIEESMNAFMKYAPGIWEELIGLQDGLHMDMTQVLLNFGHYRVYTKPSGCSVFTTEDYMVRNYDYHPATYDGRFTFYQPSDVGYATMAPVSRITGRMDGMNEHGLVMGYNFMHRKAPGDGFVCYMIGRMILEYCKDVEEAVDFLQEIPHRSSFSYILLDKSGVTKIVEATPREKTVRNHHYCTNHFEVLTHENRRVLDDSKMRMQHLKQLNSHIDARTAFRIMNDPDEGIFSNLYSSWSGTIHTSCYHPKDMTCDITLGSNGTPVTLNLQDWLDGKPLPNYKITGQIDTHLTFASE